MSDPNRDLPVVMILGDQRRAEMRGLAEWLEQWLGPSSRRVDVADVSEVLRQSGRDLFPSVIIVLQSWPDEYSRNDINQLLTFAPLARIVVCYGAWCESDGRNRSLWPQSVRVPLWAAQARIEREWRLIQNSDSLPPLPWSASRDEVFAADHPSVETATTPYSFEIDTPDPAFRRAIVEIMLQAGHHLSKDDPGVVLFDVDPWVTTRAAALKALITQYPTAIRVAVANLCLSAIEDKLREIGVTRILPKLGFRPPIV